MKRAFLILIACVTVAGAVWYTLRVSQNTSPAVITALLPRETILLLHVPDFNRTRDQWRQSDLYELYSEPEVQEFLGKPLSRIPQSDLETLEELEQLEPKDGFFALTSIAKANFKFTAGFRFRGSESDAEKIIGKWRAKLLEKNPEANRTTREYQRHRIDTITVDPFTLASAYAGNWFFLASNPADLEAVLDRVDERRKDRQSTIDAEESYRAATAHMPPSYAALFYLQSKALVDQLHSFRAAFGVSADPEERTFFEQITSVCGAVWLDAGKIHDLLFIGIPKIEQVAPMTRSSLNLATKDTVFYIAMLLNIGQQIDALSQLPGIGARIEKLFQTFAENNIAPEDWKTAFGSELGAMVDWPQTRNWPSVLMTLPVIDAAKAAKIVETAMRMDEDSVWMQTEKNGVRYFSMQSPASLIAITPTIALSDRLLIAGLNDESVEEAFKRSQSSTSELASTQAYKSAVRSLPPPTNLFTYLRTALLYSRLDITVRPLLVMAAAFTPSLRDSVDLQKIPSPEVVTKHLSPIVSSQRYERDGYLAESIGPVTLNQAGIGLAILLFGFENYTKGVTSLSPLFAPLPSHSPSPTP